MKNKLTCSGRLSDSQFAGLESLEGRLLLAAVAWDGGGGDNLWETAANWSADVLPGSADDVTINDAAEITVRLTSGTHSINSLISHDAVTIEGGSLTVGGFTSTPPVESTGAWFTNTLTLSGGTLDASANVGGKDVDIRVSTGTLVLNSGQILGDVAVENTPTTIGASYTDPSLHLIARGFDADDATLDGNLSAGQHLTVQGTSSGFFSHAVLKWRSGLQNAGTITLENVADTSANLDLFDGTLVNTATGVIEARTAMGGVREIRGTGSITNRGSITAEAGVLLTISGVNEGTVGTPDWVPITYQSDGGTTDGAVYLVHADVDALDDPMAPGPAETIQLGGFDNRFVGDVIPSNITLRIQGAGTDGAADALSNAVLTLTAASTTNQGVIVLDSADILPNSPTPDAVASANLDIGDGAFVNEGSIQINAGEGGAREIRGSGTLVNEGSIAVESTTFAFISGVLPQGAGEFSRITYGVDGGTLSGPIFLTHSNLTFLSPPTAETEVVVVGFDNMLLGDVPANAVVAIHGTDTGLRLDGLAHGVLALTQNTVNHGVIVLAAEDIDPTITDDVATANLDLAGFTLTNMGSIEVDLTAHPGRFIKNGPLDNQGVLDVDADLEFLFDAPIGVIDPATVDHTNSGLIRMEDSDILFRGRSVTNQSGGKIEGDGELGLNGANSFIINSGAIKPGASPGSLTITTEAFSQTATGSIEIEIAGDQEGDDYDQVVIKGPAALGGQLIGRLINGFVPDPGDVFEPLVIFPNAGLISGTFTNAPGDGQVAIDGGRFDVTYMNTAVFLTDFEGLPEVTVLLDGQPLVDNDGLIDFGVAFQGQAAVDKTFTIRNDGGAAMNLGALAVSSGFVLIDGLAVPSLPAGGSESFTVRLPTGATGAPIGQISVNTNDADENPFNIPVKGQVVPPPPEIVVTVGGGASLTDGQGVVNFGIGIVSQAAPQKTFTIRNTGGEPLSLSSLSIPSGFVLIDGLATPSLAPGATEPFTVRMPTTSEGDRMGVIVIGNGDADENPFEIAVEGHVVPNRPEIAVLLDDEQLTDNNGFVDFGTAIQNQAAPQKTFTIRNEGGQVLNLGALGLSPGFVLIDGLAVASLAPGATESFTVRMPTASPGSPIGQIFVNSNDDNENPFNIPIKGKVVSAQSEVTVLEGGNPLALNGTVAFGSVTQGQPAPQKTFTIRNDGAMTLTLASLSLPSGFVLIQGLPTAQLGPDASASFVVRMPSTAGNVGAHSGTMSFNNNDSDENPFTLTLTGTVA